MKWCFVLLALISVSFQSAGGRPVTAGEIKGRLFKRYFSQCLTNPILSHFQFAKHFHQKKPFIVNSIVRASVKTTKALVFLI